MRFSESFIPTTKEDPQEAESLSHRITLRSGMIRALAAGIYSYLPLGFSVLQKIENIIRKNMNMQGAHELLLPALQPLQLWRESNRDEQMGETMIRFQDRKGRQLCLGPTHEEVITDLIRQNVSSYRQLPLILYQIQTKFRDEPRVRFGIVRSCEFIMKDAYSFDVDEQGLDISYRKMQKAYRNIMSECGVHFIEVSADPGVMGGSESTEFLVPAESGEDTLLYCAPCHQFAAPAPHVTQCQRCKGTFISKPALEIGHVFKLGTKYSKPLGAYFLDKDGKRKHIIMGCYGIGVSRLIAAIIEQCYDVEKGLIWPSSVAPFKVELISLGIDEAAIKSLSERIYKKAVEKHIEILWDDRAQTPGVKFNDAQLIGIPVFVVIGKKTIQDGKVEIHNRIKGTKEFVDEATLFTFLDTV